MFVDKPRSLKRGPIRGLALRYYTRRELAESGDSLS